MLSHCRASTCACTATAQQTQRGIPARARDTGRGHSHDAPVAVGILQPPHDVLGAVGAAVINDDDLEFHAAASPATPDPFGSPNSSPAHCLIDETLDVLVLA